MNKLSPSQAEVVKEIGAFLRHKRQEKSIAIEDISAATMIRLPMLEALEQGAADYLPELVYVKGFVKRYAQSLKIDSKNLIDRLNQVQEPLKMDIPEFSPAITAPVISAPASKEEKIPVKAAGYGQRESRKSDEKALKTSPTVNKMVTKPTLKANPPYWLWGLLGLGGLLLTLGYLFTRPKTTPGVSQSKPSPVASPIVNKPVVKPSPVAQKPAPKPSPPLNEVSTKVKLEEDSWLLVLVDGEKQYEGVMKAGEEQTWRGKEKVSIRAGNAGAVKVSVNKNPPRNLGNAGEVKEMTFTPGSTNNNP
ncbi:MAG: hypothetical protein N5P05_000321 [Chroococcopsis gigantea SAG 12.99]|jgi:cytoskeleton protein RodZ|nr:hypothetical protein [Chroococcopsis gigantea SAG 12.99]